MEVRVLVFLLMDLARLPSVSDRLNEMTPDLTALAPLYLLYVPRHNAFYTLVIQFNVNKEKKERKKQTKQKILFFFFFFLASSPSFFNSSIRTKDSPSTITMVILPPPSLFLSFFLLVLTCLALPFFSSLFNPSLWRIQTRPEHD